MRDEHRDTLRRRQPARRVPGAQAWPIAVVAATSLLLAVGPAMAQLPDGPTQNALAGSHVFGVKGCARCHAVNGLGGEVGPDLGRISERRSFYELGAALWNHLPQMRERMRQLGIEQPTLSAREVGDLIAFLFTLDYFDPPGDVELGRRLFRGKQCVKCHQVRGYGGVVGPNLDHLSQYSSPIQVATAMWNHGPGMFQEMMRRGIERPTFSGDELIDLIAYLESVTPRPRREGPMYVMPGRPGEGREVFSEKACVQCHRVGGRGGRVGPDLSDVGRDWSVTEFAAAMWNKAPAMMQVMQARGIEIPELSPGEMADLVAYLYSVEYFAEAGDAGRGRQRVRREGCLGCHALNGAGARLAGNLTAVQGVGAPGSVVAAMWNHIAVPDSILDWAEVAWPTLRAEQMADISAFLQATGRSR